MSISNRFASFLSFFREVKTETKKVNWPTREQTIKDTIIVILFATVIAVFLWIFDLIFQQLLERFIL